MNFLQVQIYPNMGEDSLLVFETLPLRKKLKASSDVRLLLLFFFLRQNAPHLCAQPWPIYWVTWKTTNFRGSQSKRRQGALTPGFPTDAEGLTRCVMEPIAGPARGTGEALTLLAQKVMPFMEISITFIIIIILLKWLSSTEPWKRLPNQGTLCILMS